MRAQDKTRWKMSPERTASVPSYKPLPSSRKKISQCVAEEGRADVYRFQADSDSRQTLL